MVSRLLGGILLAVIFVLPVLAQTSFSPERRKELGYMVLQDCGSCHGMTLQGGLGKPLTVESIAEMPDEALVELILEGMPGTPMPPWKALITRPEAEWMVRFLRNGGKDVD
jgi:cytochrome c55X